MDGELLGPALLVVNWLGSRTHDGGVRLGLGFGGAGETINVYPQLRRSETILLDDDTLFDEWEKILLDEDTLLDDLLVRR